MEDHERCVKRISTGAWSRDKQCSRRGIIEEDGARWCKQHAPSEVEKRRNEKFRQWDREAATASANRELERCAWALARDALQHGIDKVALESSYQDLLEAERKRKEIMGV